MATEAYTDQTVDLVTRLFRQHVDSIQFRPRRLVCSCGELVVDLPDPAPASLVTATGRWVRHRSAALLDGLASAGLLVPADGKVREERSWSHRDGTDCTDEDCHDRRAVTRMVSEWPDGTELTTPWVEVRDGG